MTAHNSQGPDTDDKTFDREDVSILLVQMIGALLRGEMGGARAKLRECVSATCGFAELGRQIGKDPKNLMRMLGPNGNPTASNLMEIFGICAVGMNVHIAVEVAEDDPSERPPSADPTRTGRLADGEAKDVEPTSALSPLEPTLTLVGQDEMFSVRRYQGSPPRPLAMPFEWLLRSRLVFLEDLFLAQGWPQFRLRVMSVSEEDVSWEACLAADGVDPRAEVLTEGQQRIETGINFIHRRLVPLTELHWAIMEAKKIQSVLDSKDPDEKLRAAHELGILHEQANRHEKDLHGLTLGHGQIRSAKKSGAAGAAAIRKGAQVWKKRAAVLAREYWESKPDASTSEVATHVTRKLNAEGCSTTRNLPPSNSTVRKVIAPLRP